MPQVSVIIPAYNAAGTVGAAVDSVLAQTWTDFELVVVDDGSSDGTARVARARIDPRLRCVRIDNGGVARARNRGVSLTSAPLVAFLDADDAWHPAKLERQLEAITAWPGAGLCFTGAEVVDDELRPVGADPARLYGDYAEALLTIGNVVPGGGSSALARRSLLDEVGGFDPGLSQVADWDLWLRLSLRTEFAGVSAPLVRYRRAPGSMSSDPALLERDTFAMLDKFFATPDSARYRPLRDRAYAVQWMVCSGTYLHAGRPRDAVRCAARGLAADPRSVRRLLVFPAAFAARVARR